MQFSLVITLYHALQLTNMISRFLSSFIYDYYYGVLEKLSFETIL